MSNTQIHHQMNSQGEFGSGIWRLWPFSVISRSLQKNRQSLEMRLLQLNEQQESLATREEALSIALRKVEQISLQHQQNNIVEIDRLEQEVESLASRIVDAHNAIQRPHASTPDNSQKLPSPQDPIPANKDVVSELTSQSSASEDAYLLEATLNSVQKDIRALQVHARAQAMRVSALAALAGETLPNFAGGDLSPAQPLADDLKRLSTRERNIALKLKQLSNAAH
jgi:chromosome segregation ATPase